ncbi:hypothetical protein GJAV_G00239890 [Gymnothorax javanicus]|nr:hypothetical protein GJAV_G00239890 [Gymnothorax javanicus]
MPAKTPIYLKSANSKKGKKCRLRDILSPDMISPPLGDFRHTVHIGKGGERDAFGDMSFLQGNFDLLAGKERVSSQQNGGHSEYLRANSASEASFSETPSPVLKNAISLPTIGGSQALTLPLISTVGFPPKPDHFHGAGPPAHSSPDRTEETDNLDGESLLLSLDVLHPNSSPQAEPKRTASFLFNEPAIPPEIIKPAKSPLLKKVEDNQKTIINKNGYESGTVKMHLGENIYNGGNTKAHIDENMYESRTAEVQISGNVYNGGTAKVRISENGYDTPPPGYTNGNDGIHQLTETLEHYTSWLDSDGIRESRICDFDFELSKGQSPSLDSISKITGSLLSLELDLGPSILDDVLNIMDRP